MDRSRVLQAIRSGSVDPFFSALLHKDSPSAPEAPAPATTSTAQTQSNLATAQANGILSNPNVTDIYGNTQTVTQGTPTPIQNPDGSYSYVSQPNVTQTLSPTQQGLLNSQNQISAGLLDTGQTALGQAQQTLSKPFDMSSVNDIYNQAYAAQTARLDPQWQQNTEQEQAQLANQGLVPGDAAYDNAMRDFNQGKNDAYQQATTAAIGAMPQTYQLASAAYNQPLNEVNALRTGDQVQAPTFTSYAGPNVAGTSTLTAQQQALAQQNNAYNAQVGSANSFNSGLASLGSSALMYAALA